MAATLDDLKQQIHDLPLSEVLGKYLHVQRVGAQTKAVCPFHDDHDPSLQINDDKGFWYCFVDQIGGDAIEFVRRLKGLEFKEALEDLCDTLGWNFQDYVYKPKANPKYQMGKKILTKAGQLYKKVAETGKYPAFQTFLAKRGLEDETVHTYELGFAPKQNPLSNYLLSIPEEKERQFALKVALELGIIKHSQYGDCPYYDQFRERIIFPIWDSSGQIIGLTGRATLPDQKPKYFNSIDSFLFRKHDLLYGFHLAKKAVRDHGGLILVEGNMDQMALHQAGFKHCVAIMGTGFRTGTATKILALSRKIYLCLDSDQGGQKAAERINKEFMKQGVIAYHVELGPYKDPDELIQEKGRLEFQKRIDEAEAFLDVHIERAFPRPLPELPERKLEALTHFFEILSPLGKALSATERVISLAKRLRLQSDSSNITHRYEDFLKGLQGQTKTQSVPQADSALPPQKEGPLLNDAQAQKEETQKKEVKRLTSAEKILLQNLIQYPQLFLCREFEQFLRFTQSEEVKAYILKLNELMYEIDQTEYTNVVKGFLADAKYCGDLADVTCKALSKYERPELEDKIVSRMAQDLEHRLEKEQLKSKKREIKERQKKAQTEEEGQKLLSELLVLDRQIAGSENKSA